jgi:CHAT domain-containing protein/tetratricopeptide (TPR) repeat protein
MKSIRHICLIIAPVFALTLCSASLAHAQSNKANELNKRVIELENAGKYAEAIPLAQQALTLYEKSFGLDHPNVAIALFNLAVLYNEQGRLTEAEPLYKRSLAIREKAFGADNIAVAQSLGNLAELYRNQGRYAEAEPLFKRAITIDEKAVGPSHPDVAPPLSGLAVLYKDEGRYSEAEPLYKRALAIQEKALGPDNPFVAQSLKNLAGFYVVQGHFAEAEPLYKRSLAIREKALGPDHPAVAQALNSLGTLYVYEGRYAEAESLFKRSSAIDEKALGPDHPDVAPILNNLASIYQHQGRYAEAEPLFKRALEIEEKALGPDHPSLATYPNNLAALYVDQARYAEAEPLYKRSLAIREKVLGPDHPYVASTLSNLATLYLEQGRYTEAEPLYKQALAIGEKAFGPDHPDVAAYLNNLAALYDRQARYAEAEPLYKRSLAIREKVLGPNHPNVDATLNGLSLLYDHQGRYADALPPVRRTISNKTAIAGVALPALFGAEAAKLISPDEAIDDGLNVVQRTSQTSASEALNALAARFSAGNDRLAQLVRKDQDLKAEAANLDKAIIGALSKEPSKRDPSAEQRIKDRIAAVAKERTELEAMLTREFPDYAALSNPQPLTGKDIQALLADDEALVVVNLGEKRSYVWAITRSEAGWKELAVRAVDVSKQVAALRNLLNFHNANPFETQTSFELYRETLAPVEELISDKRRWSLVVNGALSSLPPQLLVTRDPAGKELKDVDWLIRTHAVTMLPSIASLKVLRGRSATEAPKPLVGFADPVFDRSPLQLAENTRVAADITATRGIRGTVADVAELKAALPPLPETATELKKVAASVNADVGNLFIGADATETRVKQAKLDQYRIVYFATHGLLAGDVADFAKLNAEPALVLSLPEHPTEFDDGLLTASEVAQLRLNADWVVLSACNTASAEKPGAEALSGLARAFFYAGARSLIVSNWEVNSDSAVALMTGTFAALAADPKLSHAEALRKSMLAMIDNAERPDWADPKFWAPFVVVGEPAKPAN